MTLHLTNLVGKIGKLNGYGHGAPPQAQIRRAFRFSQPGSQDNDKNMLNPWETVLRSWEPNPVFPEFLVIKTFIDF